MKKLDDKGIALVMVLSVVMVMVTVAIQLHKNERNNMLNAAAVTNRLTLDQMTASAIHLAMAVLVKDRTDNETDSLQEDWADEETLKTLLEQIPFDKGNMGVKIIDELGKIQINALIQQPRNQYDDDVTEESHFKKEQQAIWERMAEKSLTALELLGDDIVDMEETDKDTIMDSLKDWLDKDDNETPFKGAESDYYEGLEPPYKCKNGPFDHISEVRLVRGITPELFNGIGELGGIGDYITVYGAEAPGAPGAPGTTGTPGTPRDQGTPTEGQPPAVPSGHAYDYPGKININTADLPVLTVMMNQESESLANFLVEYREAMEGDQYRNDLANKEWYKTALGETKDGGSAINTNLIRTSSDVYRIIATAELNGAKASSTAIVRRVQESKSAPWQCKVLNWETE